MLKPDIGMQNYNKTSVAAIGRIFLVAGIISCVSCNTKEPAPYGAVPEAPQLEWQKMETNMFVHFGPNTFTSAEWGDGTESADIFCPTDLDCRQWASTAKAAGMKGIIITAKHHDGFCLWPNNVSRHTVAQSKWRDGKGDVLKELSQACKEYGLKFGIYISPWDRNDPHYGTEEYNEIFRQTLQNALTSYGDVYEQWFDGACGEGPNGKRQVYDWSLFNGEVYKHQPDAVIFSDVGPGCRWVGNEAGSAGRTCWGTLNITGFEPGMSPSQDTLNCGNVHGEKWIPAETDVSIRPGWFYKDSENDQVKSVDNLLKIWYESVGRNSLLLLNVPADKRGHLHEIDSVRLMEFRAALDSIQSVNYALGAKVKATDVRGFGHRFSPENLLDNNYDTYWATDDDVMTPSVTLEFPQERKFNRVMLQEYIPLGQRIARFSIDACDKDGNWHEIAAETTVGYKRIVLVPQTHAKAIRINILQSYACPVLNEVALYQDDIFNAGDEMAAMMPGTVFVDSDEDVWKEGLTFPASEAQLLDLEEVQEIKGFYYTPRHRGEGGCIITYKLESSRDGKTWNTIYDEKMFDNIVNNPIRQNVTFPKPVKLRYLRLTPIRTGPSDSYGLIDFEVRK